MQLFDTHCHLNFEIFKNTAPEVIRRAQASGVTEMVVVGTTLANSQQAIKLAQSQGGVYAAVGVHPHKLFSYLEKPIEEAVDILHDRLIQLIIQSGVVAIGEIGFDRWPYPGTRYRSYQVTPAFIDFQKHAFLTQLEIAYQVGLPVIFHNRQAVTDLLEALNEWFYRDTNHQQFLRGKAVFHCCEPDQQLLDFAVQHHLYIGVAGDVTFNSAKQQFAKRIPYELLLLETDTPFFKPHDVDNNHQAKQDPSEPSDILKTAQKLAEIRQLPLEKLVELTTQNARDFFGSHKK